MSQPCWQDWCSCPRRCDHNHLSIEPQGQWRHATCTRAMICPCSSHTCFVLNISALIDLVSMSCLRIMCQCSCPRSSHVGMSGPDGSHFFDLLYELLSQHFNATFPLSCSGLSCANDRHSPCARGSATPPNTIALASPVMKCLEGMASGVQLLWFSCYAQLFRRCVTPAGADLPYVIADVDCCFGQRKDCQPCYLIRMDTIAHMSYAPHPMLISQLEYAFLWTGARPIPIPIGGPLAICLGV